MTGIPLARIHGVHDLRLDSVAAPVCGPDDVVVRVRECGVCGSDLGYLGMGGLLGPGKPMPLGHELWGEVAEVGANVRHVAVGEPVVVQPLGGGNNIGNGGSEGGFSPCLLVRHVAQAPGSIIRLPDNVPTVWGAMVEPLSVAQHCANRVAAGRADRAVVFGAGPIGLCIVQVLAYRGLADVVVVDLSASRLQMARELGAVALRGDDPGLADQLRALHGSSEFFGMPMPASTVYFEATGVRAVFDRIITMAGPGSRVCLAGVHKEPATLDLTMLLAREVSIIPSMGYDGEFEEVIAMLASGRIDPGVMVTHRFALTDILAAFEAAGNPDMAVKVLVDCQA